MNFFEKYKKLRDVLNVKVIKNDKILYKFMYWIFYGAYLSYVSYSNDTSIFSIDHRIIDLSL